VIVAVMGCTPSDERSAPPPEPSATLEETEEAPSPEEAALLAYESMWDVIVEESHDSNPDYSELEQYAQGDALELVEHGVGAEAEEGVVAQGEPAFSPDVVLVEDTHVEIEDCMDSTAWLRADIESGELVEPSPEEPIFRQVDAGVSFDGLTWRVSELRIWEIGSC
jgi:hypothetical protein